MRTETLRTKWGRDEYALLSASEIPELMRAHESYMRGGSWFGDSREDMRRKAELGDNSLVAEADKFLERIEDLVPMSRGWRNVDDVVGAVPNVPAFLAGHPQHMRRRERVARESAPITVYMDLTSSAMIDARDVTRRGVVLLALVRMLVEHRPVELWVGTSKDTGSRYGNAGSGTAAWRIDTAPLDLARAAYHIGAAAMARGFGYGLTNSLFRTGGGWPFRNVDLHRRTAEERLRAVFGFGDVLYVPPIHVKDQMTSDPVGWLRTTMSKYVNREED